MSPTSDRIRWILFDADGVLQQLPQDWQRPLAELLQPEPVETLQDLFQAELRYMTGGDYEEAVAEVLNRRGCATDPHTVLDLWRSVVIDPDMLARISELRDAGIGCAMATNQQSVRVAYMRKLDQYADAFDEQFYSSEVGHAKPDPAYFSTIVERLGVRPEEALFIDDRDDNVSGARAAGLAAEVFTANAGVGELNRILDLYGITA